MERNKELLLKGKFLIPAFVAGWSWMMGNENVFPTALLMTLISLILVIDGTAEGAKIPRPSPLGAAGRPALVTFSVLIAVSSLVGSRFLPGYGGDFVRVTIHDFHGFAYMTAFLLLICMAFIIYIRWRQSGNGVSGMLPV